MSKLFYDHILDLTKLDKEIKKNIKDPEAREEIYHLIDEIVHHRMLGCILDRLPQAHHKEFLTRFSKKPHDESLIKYLTKRISTDVEIFMREEMFMLGTELLQLIKY